MPYLPIGEQQKRNIETYSCTEFGTLHAIEILAHRKFTDPSDYSERFVAIGAQNNPTGNDPQVVAEWIRHNGLVLEQVLPFNDSITSFEEYLSPDPLTTELTTKAKKWLQQYDFKHEYVFHNNVPLGNKQERLLEALQYSPIGISVTAWRKKGKLYVKNQGEPDNHWTVLVAGERGKSWHVFDSYQDDGNFIKELAWDYDFGYAKLYHLTKAKKKSLFQKWYKEILK